MPRMFVVYPKDTNHHPGSGDFNQILDAIQVNPGGTHGAIYTEDFDIEVTATPQLPAAGGYFLYGDDDGGVDKLYIQDSSGAKSVAVAFDCGYLTFDMDEDARVFDVQDLVTKRGNVYTFENLAKKINGKTLEIYAWVESPDKVPTLKIADKLAVAPGADYGSNLAIDSNYNFWSANTGNLVEMSNGLEINRYSLHAGNVSPFGATYDSLADVIWVSDATDNRIYKYSMTGTYITRITTTATQLLDLTYDSVNDSLWVLDGDSSVLEINKSTGATISTITGNYYKGVTYDDAADALLVSMADASLSMRTLRRLSKTGTELNRYHTREKTDAITYDNTNGTLLIGRDNGCTRINIEDTNARYHDAFTGTTFTHQASNDSFWTGYSSRVYNYSKNMTELSSFAVTDANHARYDNVRDVVWVSTNADTELYKYSTTGTLLDTITVARASTCTLDETTNTFWCATASNEGGVTQYDDTGTELLRVPTDLQPNILLFDNYSNTLFAWHRQLIQLDGSGNVLNVGDTDYSSVYLDRLDNTMYGRVIRQNFIQNPLACGFVYVDDDEFVDPVRLQSDNIAARFESENSALVTRDDTVYKVRGLVDTAKGFTKHIANGHLIKMSIAVPSTDTPASYSTEVKIGGSVVFTGDSAPAPYKSNIVPYIALGYEHGTVTNIFARVV